MKPRIYVDFNTMTMLDNDRVYINRVGDTQEAVTAPTDIYPGMLVTLHDEELEVEGIVELLEVRPGYAIWQALPDWATRRDLPFAKEGFMGSWGNDAFENDAALDWLNELELTEDVALLKGTFEAVVGEEEIEYVEVDECCRAIAAAEIVAALKGDSARNLPPIAIAWVQANVSTLKLDAIRLVPLAIQVVQRIRSDSELKELSEEALDYGLPKHWDEWCASIANLEARLGR